MSRAPGAATALVIADVREIDLLRMNDARGFARHVVNHLAAQGPKTLKQVVVIFDDGAEVRGFVTAASADAVTLCEESSGRAVPLHFARVRRAEVHHYDGTSQVFE